jgi:hypothetical protein
VKAKVELQSSNPIGATTGISLKSFTLGGVKNKLKYNILKSMTVWPLNDGPKVQKGLLPINLGSQFPTLATNVGFRV